MPDPMTKEKRAELRKLAEQFKAGLGYTVADMYMQMVSAPEMRLLLSGIEALDAAEAAKQCIPPAGETPIEGLPGHSIIIRHHPELASVEVEFAYPDTGGFVTFLADLPEMYAKETLQLKADLLDYSQQLGEMQTKLDAVEAEAGRLREVVGKLPVTADGVPVTPGMKVFWVSEDPRSIAGIMVEYITDADAYWRDRGEEMGIPLEWAMSTEAAARAAQGTSPDESLTVEDGHGSKWGPCPMHGCKMQVMRPGDARCPKCEREWWTEWSAKESAQGTSDAGKGETK